METTVNERIRMLFENSREKSIRSYALKIGIPPTTLNECIKGAEPRHTLLSLIINGDPSISAGWLLTGKGEMNRNSEVVEKMDVYELRQKLSKAEKQISYLEELVDLLREKKGADFSEIKNQEGKSA